MDWRRWIGKREAAVTLIALCLVINPELRALLLLASGLGLELTIFVIVLQLRSLITAAGIAMMQVARSLCGPAYTALRGTTRAMALLALPVRATIGLSTFLFVLSHNLSCPLAKPHR